MLVVSAVAVGCQQGSSSSTATANSTNQAPSNVSLGGSDMIAEPAAANDATNTAPQSNGSNKPLTAEDKQLAGSYKIEYTPETVKSMQEALDTIAKEAVKSGMSEADVDAMVKENKAGMEKALNEARLNVRDDGTFVFTIGPQSLDGTWKADANSRYRFKASKLEQANQLTMFGGSDSFLAKWDTTKESLSVLGSGQSVVFKKV